MKIHRVLPLVLLAFICAVVCSAQGVRNPGPPDVVTDQEQYVSYWTTEHNWHSELQLRNNSPSVDLVVTPSLRAADGTETKLAAVTVKSHEVASVHLHDALMAVGLQPSTNYGSVVLRYKAVAAHVLYAALMVHRDSRPIAFHIDAMGQLESDTDSFREGIWWFPNDKVNDYLILANQGNLSIPVSLSLYDAAGKTYTKAVLLAPRQTLRYSVRQMVRESSL